MWERVLKKRLLKLAKEFPAVLILGPRQVGKTTLAKMVFSEGEYVDLEDPVVKELFQEDILFQLMKDEGKEMILDEAQVMPEIFSALRSVIDRKKKKKKKFVILGSAQPGLIRGVSESLAGRVGIVELMPLTMQEVSDGKLKYDYETVWLKGGFPKALKGDFREWWDAYLKTFIERDLKLWGIETDAMLMRRLLIMLAHQQGGLFNASEMGRALGVNYHTIDRYVKILEDTFLVRKLPPYFKNVKKRLVKSPKVYIRDTGLLHHLLNINTKAELNVHPVRGRSWETFVLEDIIRRESIVNPFTQFYFWRTQAGAEVDLVLERGMDLYLIEMKAGMMVQTGQIKKLLNVEEDLKSKGLYIINQGEKTRKISDGIMEINFNKNYKWLP